MTKIQIYSDVSLSAVEDIGNIVFNRISTKFILSIIENENIFLFEDKGVAYERLNVTRFSFCHVLKTNK